jgi:hypothetical protein
MTEFGSDYFFLAEPHTGSEVHLAYPEILLWR